MGRGVDISKYSFIAVLLLLLYLTFIVVSPFITYIFMGFVLVYFAGPVYKVIHKSVKSRTIASWLMIILIILVIIIPSFFITRSLAYQASEAFYFLDNGGVGKVLLFLESFGLSESVINNYAGVFLGGIKDFILNVATDFLESVVGIFLGLFIMFFVMYYSFKEGENFRSFVMKYLPLKKSHKEKLLEDVASVTSAVLYGHIMTSVIQGLLGGLAFVVFGIPNPVFWAFVMTILAMIPVTGTLFVWLPAGLIELASGNYVSGIGIIAFGALVIMNIDNFLRPKLISKKSDIHPVAVLIGILGGLALFGIAGLILGPLILALTITMIKFYFEERPNVLD
ncbi:hypothetical protein COU61_01890 [Candidatus Pacearchaeota archaeon CG10_big_fil_rev_8_21_14_0_10_35_13]|nr:MAG: hypothetical protein COU61_01890 [Candidatus Pacearchaeota archaeon CG10_big_fil_rev_8_21_14_0_10_35_13]